MGIDEPRDENMAREVKLPFRAEGSAGLRGRQDVMDPPAGDRQAMALEDAILAVDRDDPLSVDEELRVHGK
jgi:hypothetical protein